MPFPVLNNCAFIRQFTEKRLLIKDFDPIMGSPVKCVSEDLKFYGESFGAIKFLENENFNDR